MLCTCVCVALLSVFLSQRVVLRVGHLLEERFPSQPVLPAELRGIIILGGDLEYHQTGPNTYVMESPRIAAAIPLAVRFRNAEIVISGAYREASDGRSMLIAGGISGSRIITETDAKTTCENAALTRVVIWNQLGGPWALVTSAVHMPRAIGSFRQAGFKVIGVPSDYKATPEALARTSLREALGLIIYRIIGCSNALLPSPES
jgi:uncharacterized SAM-binding protein YcdF (DUF218 family)